MAPRITWSQVAAEDFNAILSFYAKHNGNKVYSEKLARQMLEAIESLRENPLLRRPSQ